MTLREFARAVNSCERIGMELRDIKEDEVICCCRNDSKVIDVYGKCEVTDWSRYGDGVVVHIDDSEVMRWIAQDVEEEQKS